MVLSLPIRLVYVATAVRLLAVAGEGRDTAVEIGAHSFQVKPATHPKRLIRTQDAREGSKSTESDLEVPVGSVLDSTIRRQKEAVFASALLSAKGPGHIGRIADPWNASLAAMTNLSQSLSYDCNARYGQQMLDNLMEGRNAHHLCSGPASTITCHERDPFDVPRYMCELKNVMISPDGTSVSGCKKSGDFDSFTAKQGITENSIFGKSTQFGGLKHANGTLKCPSTASARLAIVQVPCDTHNFYEWYGDWVTLWETLAAMKKHPTEVDVYLLGNVSGGGRPFARPFDEAWSRAFKVNHLHIGGRHELFGEGTCFPHVVTVPQGALSTMTFGGGRAGFVGCPSSTVMASALFLQALFPSPLPSTLTHEKDIDQLLRTNKTNTTKKTLTLLLRTGMRKFVNDDGAISAVKSVLPSDWTLNLYRPENTTTFAEQLAVASSTQVFVGVHGAGMMHVLFLPPKARVVEIFCEDRAQDVNHHYRNLEMMGEPAVGPDLFSYYFSSSAQTCKVDPRVIADAIKAYDGNPALSAEFSTDNLERVDQM